MIDSYGRVGYANAIDIQLCNPQIELSASPMQYEIGIGIDLIGNDVVATITNMCPQLNLEFCELKEIRLGEYLLVDKDVLWVTPDIWEQLQIMSNLEWTIN